MFQLILHGQASLNSFRAAVVNPINVLLLGSRGDDFFTPPSMLDRVKVFGIDAASPQGAVHFTALQQLLSEKGGPASFILRKHGGVSGLLEADMDQVKGFGQEHWYEEVSRKMYESQSITEMMKSNNINRAHYLKTDLEGIDFPVVCSLGDRIKETLVLKMECRFEPMNVGEHLFPEIAHYLYGKQFRVLDLAAYDKWRYRTAHWSAPTRGRLNYVDVLFINTGELAPVDTLIQAYLLAVLGYLNMSERILEKQQMTGLEDSARRELIDFMFSAMAGKQYIPFADRPHSVGATF